MPLPIRQPAMLHVRSTRKKKKQNKRGYFHDRFQSPTQTKQMNKNNLPGKDAQGKKASGISEAVTHLTMLGEWTLNTFPAQKQKHPFVHE